MTFLSSIFSADCRLLSYGFVLWCVCLILDEGLLHTHAYSIEDGHHIPIHPTAHANVRIAKRFARSFVYSSFRVHLHAKVCREHLGDINIPGEPTTSDCFQYTFVFSFCFLMAIFQTGEKT